MISPKVMVELHQAKLVPTQFTVTKPGEHAWSAAEQRRFWEAIHRFPQGPWTAIAAYVGSKSTRQAMTHAQKLRQKLNRWKRRVRNDSNSSSGASSPRSSDANEFDEDDDELAVCALDDESAMKREQQIAYSHSHSHHAIFDLASVPHSSASSSSFSPDDVSSYDNDEYLDQLLSDIEPVLENVVHFTSSPRCNYETSAALYYNDFATSSAASAYSVADSKQPLADLTSPFGHHAMPTLYHLQQQQQQQQEYAADFRL